MVKFKKENLQDRVLYYFPHSARRLEPSYDDVGACLSKSNMLKNHTYLLAKEEINAFSKMVVSQVTPKIRYTKELAHYNSHINYLTDLFKIPFHGFVRPGNYLDALVAIDATPSIKHIRTVIQKTGVKVRNTIIKNKNYLVIPSVNTRPVAERIRTLPSH